MPLTLWHESKNNLIHSLKLVKVKYCIFLHRPGNPGSTATGRGVLSLTGLSYGVVRVDKEGSLTALTLQDCGMVIPGGKKFFIYILLMNFFL